MKTERPLTGSESDAIRKYFPGAFLDEYPRLFPGRSAGAVTQAAAKLGVKRGPKTVFFPRTYTNDVDGGYVTGLVDGEGSFMVSLVNRRDRWNFNPKFGITLRVDDGAILRWLRTYFGCGRYSETFRTKSPRASLVVADLYSLMAKVLPHFDRYPLRAKKQKDYAIWRDMVLLQAENFRRAWTPEVRRTMRRLCETLRAGRLLVE